MTFRKLMGLLGRRTRRDECPIDVPNALAVVGTPELLREILEGFCAEADPLPAIRDALATGNGGYANGETHRLKSAFASFGALEARRLALELESLVKAGRLPEALAAWPALAREMDRLKTFVADRARLRQALDAPAAQE